MAKNISPARKNSERPKIKTAPRIAPDAGGETANMTRRQSVSASLRRNFAFDIPVIPVTTPCEADMTQKTPAKDQKVENPSSTFDKPIDVVKAPALTPDEKKEALNTWEQDARQLLTASNEGMPGPEEGLEKKDTHKFGEVVRAKDTIGQKPKHKPSQ
jgi:hypothetical protein